MDTEKTLAPRWPGKKFQTEAPINVSNRQLDGIRPAGSSPLTTAGRGGTGSIPLSIRLTLPMSLYLIMSTDVHHYPTKHDPKNSLE